MNNSGGSSNGLSDLAAERISAVITGLVVLGLTVAYIERMVDPWWRVGDEHGDSIGPIELTRRTFAWIGVAGALVWMWRIVLEDVFGGDVGDRVRFVLKLVSILVIALAITGVVGIEALRAFGVLTG